MYRNYDTNKNGRPCWIIWSDPFSISLLNLCCLCSLCIVSLAHLPFYLLLVDSCVWIVRSRSKTGFYIVKYPSPPLPSVICLLYKARKNHFFSCLSVADSHLTLGKAGKYLHLRIHTNQSTLLSLLYPLLSVLLQRIENVLFVNRFWLVYNFIFVYSFIHWFVYPLYVYFV